MSAPGSGEFTCPACGKESLLLREPIYDGFTRVGEKLSCASCRHIFEDESEISFRRNDAPKIFTEADRPEEVQVFEEGEAGRLCRYCESYVVNPFMQWCGLHKKEVAATDTCDQFSKKEVEEEEEEEDEAGPI